MDYDGIYEWLQNYIEMDRKRAETRVFDKIELTLAFINNHYEVVYDINNTVLGDFVWVKENTKDDLIKIFDTVIRKNLEYMTDTIKYLETLL